MKKCSLLHGSGSKAVAKNTEKKGLGMINFL
jgi:hypothetical protein